MARQRKSLWGTFDKLARRTVRESLKASQRSPGAKMMRAAGKAVAQASHDAARQMADQNTERLARAARQVLTGVASPVEALPAAAGGSWSDGHWGVGPLALRKYRVYRPVGLRARQPAPLLVLLHGCAQDSASFATSTRVVGLARRLGFIVLLPEQSAQANPNRCWNWFQSEPRVALEATILMAIIDHVVASQPIDPRRVVVAGISAGGTMALTLALHHPDRFAGVGAFSCASPYSAAHPGQAAQAMRGRVGPDVTGLLDLLAGRRPPPLLVLHGDRDRVVSADNATANVALWLQLHRAANPGPSAPTLQSRPPKTVKRGERHPAAIVDWTESWRGAPPYVRMIHVEGLAHAWSGGAASQAFSDPKGPDALKLAWQFFTVATTIGQ